MTSPPTLAPDAAHLVGPAVRGYLEAALWTNDDDAPSGEYVADLSRVSGSAERTASDEVADYVLSNAADCLAYVASGREPDHLGHDLLLSRDGHGAGFFDRGLGDLGDRLQDAARVYGDAGHYWGDDDLLYAL